MPVTSGKARPTKTVATLFGKTLDANATEEVAAAAKPMASMLRTMKQRAMNTVPEGALSRNLFERRGIVKMIYCHIFWNQQSDSTEVSSLHDVPNTPAPHGRSSKTAIIFLLFF